MSVLVLSNPIRQQIEQEGVAAYPDECCGILIGIEEPGAQMTRRVVERIIPMANAFDESEQYHRFSIDPKSLMQAEREAGKTGKLVLGFYHSHPDEAARPSEYDRTHAWEFYSYVIVSIKEGKPADLTAWMLTAPGGGFRSQDIYRH